MKILDKEYYVEFQFFDSSGDISIEFQKDCSQIRVKKADEELSINVDEKELTAIKECIEIILNNENKIKNG